jgi:hypothetical protein
MVAAGPSPSAGDRNELLLMGTEKVAAACQAWWSMYWQVVRLQVDLGQSAASSALGYRAFTPWTINRSATAAARVLSAGLAPVHRKATRNAKRLTRGRR